jgi:hypothetical protein
MVGGQGIFVKRTLTAPEPGPTPASLKSRSGLKLSQEGVYSRRRGNKWATSTSNPGSTDDRTQSPTPPRQNST